MSRDFSTYPVLALVALAQKEQDDPLCTIYVSSFRGTIIICANRTAEKALYFEQEEAKGLEPNCSNEVVGEAIWEALLKFKGGHGINLRSLKRSDWPAFQASRAESIRAFEEEYVRASIRARGSMLSVEANVSQATPDANVFVGAHISAACDFDALGEVTRRVCQYRIRLCEGPA